MSNYKSARNSYVIAHELNPALKELAKLNGTTVSMFVNKLIVDALIDNKDMIQYNETLDQMSKVRKR